MALNDGLPAGFVEYTGDETGANLDSESRKETLRKIAVAESDNRNIDNLGGTSSATGLYQITKPTFDLAKAKFPELRSISYQDFKKDTDLQTLVADKLLEDNAKILKAKGAPTDDLSQYTMWFSGNTKLATAPSDARAEDVLTKEQVAANSFVKGKTVGELRDYFNNRLNKADVIPKGFTEYTGDSGGIPEGFKEYAGDKSLADRTKDIIGKTVSPITEGIAALAEPSKKKGSVLEGTTLPELEPKPETTKLPGFEHLYPSDKSPFNLNEDERTEKLILQGLDPEFARATARRNIAENKPTTGAEYGIARPLTEEEIAGEEAKKEYKAGEAGSLSRIGGKSKEQYKSAVYGGLRFIGDMAEELGADEFGERLASGAGKGQKESQAIIKGIGENPNKALDFIETGVSGAVNTLTPFLAGPTAGLTAMATQVFGQEYGEGRDAGLNKTDAIARASAMTTAELIGETVSMPVPMFEAFKKAAKGVPIDEIMPAFSRLLVKEGFSEQVTTALQFGTDKWAPFGITPNATFDDYLRAVKDTFYQTMAQTMVVGGTGVVVGKTQKALGQKEEPAIPTAKEVMESKGFKTERPEEAPKETKIQPTFREVAPEEEQVITPKAEPGYAAPIEPIEIKGVGQTEEPVASQDFDAMLAELEGKPVAKEEVVAEEPAVEKPVAEEPEKVVMFKDYSPEDQQNIRSMEVEKNKIKKEKKLFPEFLRRQGIQPSEKADLGLEGVKRIDIFREAAPSFDELTSRAINEGFLVSTGDDVQDVANMREHVANYIGNKVITTGPDTARDGQIQSIDDAIQEIARKYEKPAFGLEETTPAQLRADEEKRKAREAEAARIEAEDQAKRDREEIARLSQSSEFALGKTAAEDLMGQKSVFDQEEEAPAKAKTTKELSAITPKLAEDLKALPRETMSDVESEAMDIADRIESYGEKDFATGLRSAVKNGRIKSEANLDFYKKREQDYAARVGKAEEPVSEKLSMANFMEGYPLDRKRLDESKEMFETQTSKLLDMTDQYIQDVTDMLNKRGYKYLDVNTTSPFDIQDLHKTIGQMAGSMNLVLRQGEAFRKGYTRANEKKLEDAVSDLLKDFGKVDTIIDMEEQAKKSKAEAEKKKSAGDEDADIPFFAPSGKYVTVDEIYQMQRDAYKELSETEEFKKSQKIVEEAREAYSRRFQDVKKESIRLLKENPEFSRVFDAIKDEGTISRLAMQAFGKEAERNVPEAKPSESEALAAQNKLINDYFAKKQIPEPREFSEYANQKRSYYNDPKFKKWFGDSKVVDKDGNPLVAFHTTNKDFNKFNTQIGEVSKSKNPNYTGQLGSWFTAPSLDNNEYELGNAESAVSFYEGQEGDKTMPVHLSIKNPMEYEGFDDLREDRDSYPSIEKFKQSLVKAGYDGIVVRDSMTDGNVVRDDWVAFEPKQIKSAIGNRGTFSAEEADITLAPKERTQKEIIHEQILEEKIRELQGLSQRKRGVERRFVRDKSKKTDAQYYKDLDAAIRGLKEDIADMKVPDISAEQFVANAARSLANKKDGITKEVFDVIKAIYDKNPKLLEGLKLSVKTSDKPAAGEFAPNTRIVSLYKGTEGVSDPSIIRHEITHTLEQMMPTDAKINLVDAWAKAALKAQKNEKTEAGKRYFEKVAKMISNPSRETFYEGLEALPKDKDGKPSLDYYQYLSPSEYWAVNAESLMESYLGGAWQRFKTYVRALFEALKNKFGFDNKSIFHKTFKDIIDGKRLSNLTLNNYIGAITKIPTLAPHKTIFGEKALSTWNAPDESKLADFIYKVQDKNIDLKNVQKAINEQVGEIEDSWNAYQKEELYHGRTAKRISDFLKNELQPIIKELSKAGLTIKQFDDFLHNRHAEERNKQIAKVNPLMPDGGSGIKTENAKKYMAGLNPEDRAAMEKIADKIDKLVGETQDILVDNGLEDPNTIKAWRKTYKHYAPLYRADLDFVHDTFGTGQGMQTRGGTTKRATGSEKEVVNVFANIAMQRERAIIRAEKARVGRALYGLAIKNPNADFWLPVNPDAIKDPKALAEELQSLGLTQADAVNFIKEPTTPDIDPNTGLVVNRVNINSRFSDNVFAIRVNGKDRFIFFNPSNEEAMRLVKSFKNMDAEQLGIVLGTVGRITRFIAAMNTQYNPVFGAWNFTRDVGGAMVNLSTTPIADKKAKVMAGVFPALRGIYKDLRSERKGKGAASGEWSALWERYQNAGGQTGYRDQFAVTPQNQTQQEQATEKTAKTLGKSMAAWLERKTASANIIEREMNNLNKGNVKKTVDAIGGWLSDYNDAMENAVRLSAFKAALDKGLSEEQAASLAKNLTVNFNRKGQISTNIGALYAFFNASVQGTARIAETLAGPSGKKIIAGGLLLGVMQAVALMMAGFDDDEPPEFLKDKNLIIPTGDGKYKIIPLPLGLAFIPALGRRITEMVVAGDKIPKRVIGIIGAFADAFNPIGTGSFAQMLSPTVADPFVSIGMNKDSFGRPIYKEDRSTNPTPGYSRSRDGASAVSKYIAEFLNWASGGTKYQKGEISPTADEIDYLAGQVTGGVGRETQKAVETVKGLITGEEVEPHRKPVTGKIAGDINSKQAVSAKFYSNVTELAKLEAEVKGRMENREKPYDVFKETPKARLIDMANDAESDISNINKEIKEIKKRNPDNKDAIKRMEDTKLRIMRDLNKRVKQLEE